MAAPPDLSKLAIDAQVRLDLLRDVHADFMRHLPKVEDEDSERIDSKAFAIDRLRTQNRITVLRSDMSFLPYRLQQVKIDQLSEADLRRFTLNLTHLLDLCERFVDEAAFDVSQIPEDEQRHDAPLSRFPKLLAFRQSLQLVKQEAADDTTSIRQIAATTTLYNVAKKCSDQFEELVSALRDHAGTGLFSEEWSYDRFVGLRNSFIYWADYLGALAPGSSSLDTRLDNHADIRLLVWELLAMVDRNIGYIAIVLKSPSDAFEEAQHIFPAVDSAISRLHSLARAIRRSSRKETDVTSLSVRGTEHEDFRRFALAYVQRLFPAARLSLYEHMSNFLTMRRVALLRMQQHAQDLAEKQEVKPTDASDTKPDIQGLRQATAPSGRTESKAPPRNQIPASKIHSPASIVTRDLPKSVFDKARFREFYHKTSTVPVASSSYSRQDDKTSSDYPPPPQFKGESGRVPCTFCREPIQINSTNLKKKTNEWTKHVDRDLQPYTCLFPRCNQLLFQHFSTWKDHMITIHSQDWYRKVHTTTWICDIGLCQKTPQTFNTEDEWKAHMRDTEYHRPPPTELQLKALSVQKQKRGERSAHQCPFCESVPEEISKLRGRGNPSDVSDIFMRHIGAHVKFLSLIALPVDGGDGAKSAEFQDSERRLRKTGSDASLPSGAASLAQISLRFTDPPDYLDLQTPWTGLDDDNMLSLGDDEPVPELHETFRWDYVWGGHSSGSKYGEMDVSNDNIIQHMISNMSIAQITALESIADLDRGVAISKKALYDTPPDHPDQAKRMRNVETWLGARFKRIGKIDDLDQVIQLIRGALHMMKLDNPDRASHLYNLGSWLEMRFQRTGDLVDFEEAISVTTEALDITPLDYPGRAFHRHNLVAWHIMRYQRTRDEIHLDQAVRLERDANNVPSGEYPALATISNSIGNQLGTQFVVPDLPDPELEQTTEAALKTAPENEPR